MALADNADMRRKLQDARTAAELTQAQAGALIGKTQSHYGKVERGLIGLSADEALILCNRLNISLADLLEIEAQSTVDYAGDAR